jgi:GNAT superfamily N-acetyltransferase
MSPAASATPDPKLVFEIRVAGEGDVHLAQAVCDLIEAAAKIRGTGIAKRESSYIADKMAKGNAIIALSEAQLAGFCYIETWEGSTYVANSGLIVSPDFRNHGLARKIKRRAFLLSRERYPDARLFGITTSLPVLRINSDLGYKPVTFSELTKDEVFWNGCRSCPNFDVLTRTERKHCLCTGMLFDPKAKQQQPEDD